MTAGFKRLILGLVIKSVADVLFIGAVAGGFYYRSFNPYLEGTVNEAGPEWVRGWTLDRAAPNTPVEVQLYIDGTFADSRLADHARPELVASGVSDDERHGFFFYTPPLPDGEHEARVYAVHESGAGRLRTLRLIGRPLRFRTYAATAEPFYRGWLDEASHQIVRGWVVSRDAPDERVEVHLYIDGRFVEKRPADYPRPELRDGKLLLDEKHGFLFFTPQLLQGEHEARVYAARPIESEKGYQLLLVGRPLRFSVAPPPAGDRP